MADLGISNQNRSPRVFISYARGDGYDFAEGLRLVLEAIQQGPEWAKFLNDVNTICTVPRVPFTCDDMDRDFVTRSSEFNSSIALLLNDKRDEPVVAIVALRGAGGFGKSTLARAICH